MSRLEVPSRIVHVLAGAGFGGAERVACTLVHFARNNGYEVTVEGAPATRMGLGEYGVATVANEDDLGTWTNAARQRVSALAPALVHLHLATPSLLGSALRIADVHPALLTLHLLPEASWPLDRLFRVPSQWLLALASRWRRRLFVNTVSTTDATLLERWVPRSKLRAIPNAPPLSEPAVSGGHAAWPDAGTRLLAVGRLVTQKGYDRLLRSLATPELRSLAWHLVVVGDGPERDRLTQLSKSLALADRITWLGAVTSTPWLRRADLVVSPSRYEGMPLVPLEAIREITPVLVSDIAPHREMFHAAAPHSLLPPDEHAWPQYLGRYLTHERCRTELANAQTALQSLADPRRQWREYATLYRQLISQT